jgi:ribosomal protein S3AE
MIMATQRGSDLWKQKKWFAVHAPKTFDNKMICEIPANDEKSMTSRDIVVALSQLTGDPGHAFTNVTLKVESVSGNVAQTKLVTMQQLQSYIRSLVRRGRSVADSVLTLKTSDGVSVTLKMIAITSARAAHSDVRSIRKGMNDYLTTYVKNKDFDTLVKQIIEGRMQADMAGKLRKIIQISKVEVRKLEVPVKKASAEKTVAVA